jgi:putative tricarboxylic transport membrane protein
VPVFLGTFALAEVIDLSASGRSTISGKGSVEELGGSISAGVVAVFQNIGLFLRSSVIGTCVGMIPGLGGTVAAFVAYGDAARADPEGTMGSGDIRGVIAPEAANDAKDGGSLLPTLALGIPASSGTAVLLGVLAIHGIRPGRELMGDGLPLVFAMIWALFLSNWLTSALGLAAVKPVSRLTIVRTRRLIPPIVVLATLGALAFRGRVTDVWVAMLFGIVGYFMKKHDWPRVAFVMAFVLGPLFELNLNLTLDLHRLDRIDFWARPSVLVLIGLIALTTLPRWVQRRLPWR